MKRPMDVPDKGLVCDLLWSDPDEVSVHKDNSYTNNTNISCFLFISGEQSQETVLLHVEGLTLFTTLCHLHVGQPCCGTISKHQ